MLIGVEERVRAAGVALGDLVGRADVPPLRLPPPGAGRRRPGPQIRFLRALGRSARARWLIPLISVAAMLAVGAVVTVVTVVFHGAGPGGQAVDSAAIPAPPGGSGPPSFAVTVNQFGAAAVQQVTTARTLRRIPNAPGVSAYLATAADAGRRTVVLAGQRGDGIALYLLRLGPDGDPGAPQPIRAPQPLLAFPAAGAGNYSFQLAMTPDGRKLAYLLQTYGRGGPARTVLGVEGTTGGVQRTWMIADNVGGATIISLSWAADDRRLALAGRIYRRGAAARSRAAVVLLDTAAAGAPDFLRDSHLLVAAGVADPAGAAGPVAMPLGAAISPDGSSVFVAEAAGVRAGLVSQVSVATGLQIRVLYRWYDAGAAAGTVKLDGTGRDLLIPVGGALRAVDVRSGRARQLPFPVGPGHRSDLAW